MAQQNAANSQANSRVTSDAENESALLYYLGVLRRQIWIVIPVVVVFGTIGLIISFRTPRVYMAVAQLLVERVTPQVMSFERGLEASAEWDREFYATQTKLVRSRTVMETALQRPDLNRMLEEESNADGVSGGSFLGEIRQTLLSLLGAEPAPPPEPWEILQERVVADHLEGTHFLLVKVLHKQAYRAAFMANGVAKAFRDYHKQRKLDILGESFVLLQNQKDEAEKELDAAQKALQDFRESAQAVSVLPSNGDQPAVDRLVKLNEELTQVQLNRVELDSQIAVMREAYGAEGALVEVSGERLFSLPVIQSDPTLSGFRVAIAEAEKELATLSQTYGAEHPLLKAAQAKATLMHDQFKEALQNVIEAHVNKLKMLVAQEQELQKKYDEQKLVTLDLAKETVTLTSLENNVARCRSLYDAIVDRMKEVDISTDMVRTNVQIVEEASIPSMPFGAARKRAFFLALLVGVFLGVGLAFLFENLDDTIKTPEDLKDNFDIPFLGFVPSVALIDGDQEKGTSRLGILSTARNGARRVGTVLRNRLPGVLPPMSPIKDEPDEERARVGMITLREPVSSVSEAYRNIRASLFYATPEDETKTLSLTSSRPQEGKSTTTCNLALSIAQTGKRVLLIDGDLHRPSVNRLLQLDVSKGLTDALVDRKKWQDVISPVLHEGKAVDNLDVICSGPAEPNPSELLGSDTMKRIIQEAREVYDWVLVDTPPILFVSDAGILSTMCDSVVVVVRAGNSTRSLLTRTTEQLRNLNAKVLGTVLNNVVISRMGRYYSSYYSYGYSQYAKDYRRTYYDERDEKPKAKKQEKTKKPAKKKASEAEPAVAAVAAPIEPDTELQKRVASLESELKELREQRKAALQEKDRIEKQLTRREEELAASARSNEELEQRVHSLEQDGAPPRETAKSRQEKRPPPGMAHLRAKHWAKRRNRQAALTKAELHVSSGNYRAALDILQELTEARPGETRAWEMMIMVLGELGDGKKLKDLVDGLKHLHKMEPHLYGLGWAQLSLLDDNPAGARKYLEEALTVAPRNTMVIETLTKALLRDGDNNKAMELVRRLLQIDPDNAYGNYVLGSHYARRGKTRRAEKALKLSLRTRTIPEAANNLGWLLMEQGNLTEGEKVVRRGLAIGHNNSRIWDTMATILTRGGRLDEAQEAVEKAVSLDPDAPALLLHCAELNLELGNSERAKELIEMLGEKRGQLPEEDRARLDKLSQALKAA